MYYTLEHFEFSSFDYDEVLFRHFAYIAVIYPNYHSYLNVFHLFNFFNFSYWKPEMAFHTLDLSSIMQNRVATLKSAWADCFKTQWESEFPVLSPRLRDINQLRQGMANRILFCVKGPPANRMPTKFRCSIKPEGLLIAKLV